MGVELDVVEMVVKGLGVSVGGGWGGDDGGGEVGDLFLELFVRVRLEGWFRSNPVSVLCLLRLTRQI